MRTAAARSPLWKIILAGFLLGVALGLARDRAAGDDRDWSPRQENAAPASEPPVPAVPCMMAVAAPPPPCAPAGPRAVLA